MTCVSGIVPTRVNARDTRRPNDSDFYVQSSCLKMGCFRESSLVNQAMFGILQSRDIKDSQLKDFGSLRIVACGTSKGNAPHNDDAQESNEGLFATRGVIAAVCAIRVFIIDSTTWLRDTDISASIIDNTYRPK
jgi:hypothetical protein